MSRMTIEGTRIFDSVLFSGNKLGTMTQVITATLVMDKDMPPLMFISSAAGNEIDLPPVADSKGLFYIIVNNGAGTLTVEDSASAALDPVASIATDEIGLYFCNGTAWRGFTGVA